MRGVSKVMYVQFPNITKTFLVKPLVVQNLLCDINLGAQFNFVTGLTPQKVVQDQNGRNNNVSELGGVKIQLQFQDVSNETLRYTIEDPEFLWWLEWEPAQQRRGVDRVYPHARVLPYTLHQAGVVQRENQRRKDYRNMKFQPVTPEKNPQKQPPETSRA